MIPLLGIHHDHAAMMMMILQGIWESQVGTGMTGGGGMTLVAQGISIILVEYTRQSSSSNTLLILREALLREKKDTSGAGIRPLD